MSPKIALFGHKLPKSDLDSLKRIYDTVEGRDERVELNLYVSGYEDDPAQNAAPETPPSVAPSSEPDTEANASAEPAGDGRGEPGPAGKSPTFPGPGEDSQSASSETETS